MEKYLSQKLFMNLKCACPRVCKSLEVDSRTSQEKWDSTLAHFHEAFADIPEEELIKEFDAILAEVRNERVPTPEENIVALTAPA